MTSVDLLAALALPVALATLAALAVFSARLFVVEGRVRSLEARVERAEVVLPLFDVRRCRVCSCTDEIACMSGCWWVEEDLCSSCDDDRVAGSSLEVRG